MWNALNTLEVLEEVLGCELDDVPLGLALGLPHHCPPKDSLMVWRIDGIPPPPIGLRPFP